jgi:hypothetical protein
VYIPAAGDDPRVPESVDLIFMCAPPTTCRTIPAIS